MIRKLKHWLGILGLAVLFWLFPVDCALAAHTHSYTAGPHYESTHKAGGIGNTIPAMPGTARPG